MTGLPWPDVTRTSGSRPGLARQRPGLTRRDLLRRGTVGAGLLAVGPVLAACSSGAATSSAVTGVPSENFTPGRNANVQVLPSVLTVCPCASQGTSWPAGLVM